ncbi:MAG: ABC transporter permease subunit [Acidobacteriota bacterium]
MLEYVVRRILLMLPTLFGISLVVFLLVNFVPGGPVEQAIQRMRGAGRGGEAGGLAGGGRGGLTKEAIEQLNKFYGFDKPVYVRYALWLRNVLALNFGKSYNYGDPVWTLIKSRIPVTLLFGGPSFVLAYLVCIPLGIFKAIHHRTWKDSMTSAMVFIGYSIPGFALGQVLLVLFGGGTFWDVFPLGGVKSDNFDELDAWHKLLDVLYHMVLPLVCYMVESFAVLTILMKNSLMENLASDYVRTAMSKGLSWRKALYRHALRNSLIPIATGFGAILTVFVSGSLLVEVTFNIHGMGLLTFEALQKRDYPVTLGIIMIDSILVLLGNLLSDLLYVVIDPRISFGGSST